MMVSPPEVSAQTEVSPKALKIFGRAAAAFDAGQYETCEKELLRAVEADPRYPDPLIMLGDVSLETGRPSEAVEWYNRALALNPPKSYIIRNILGNTLFSLERYPEACQTYGQLLDQPDAPGPLRDVIQEKLNLCTFRQQLMEQPVAFAPQNLGPGVNGPDDDYINALSADERELFFTRREPSEPGKTREFYENLYHSLKSDTGWGRAGRLGFPPQTANDAGALCISADGRMLFFTACFRPDSHGSCDLYFSEKAGGTWSVPINMGARVNSDHWDAQPSISPDGKTLYFASNRKGGYGGSDLWKTERTPDGGWTEPENLGAMVNTAESEMAPFIHFDNETLYFASSGHRGMGGTDLFLSTRNGAGWNLPVNLGYPLNSSSDELVVIVDPSGEKGYISNNSLKGEGGYDIFEFALHSEIRPVPVSYFKGRVLDSLTRQPLAGTIQLTDIDRDSLVLQGQSDKITGEFLVCLPAFRNYALNVASDGYLFHSEHFPLSEIKTRANPVTRDILLKPVAVGSKLVLRNIFFETDRYELKTISHAELDKLVEFLRQNPGLRIEISGHTDSEGTDAHNLELSALRAASVADYLILNGIAQERLESKGWGESQPVASNETEEGRALNRRTEMKIIGLKP